MFSIKHPALWRSALTLLILAAPTFATDDDAAVQVVAHRGASGPAPENTLPAVRAALNAGADLIELDVRRSADGHAILFHDSKLERTSDGEGRPEDHTLAALQKLDAGTWKHEQYAGARIPTLAAAARLCKGRARIMLDFKGEKLAEPIGKALDKADFPDAQVVLGVWNDTQLADTKEHLPSIETVRIGGLPDGYDLDWLQQQREQGIDGFSVNWDTLTVQFLYDARQRDIPVYVWTLNQPRRLHAAVAAEVTGIITNYPARLQKLLDGELEPHSRQQ